MLHDHPHIGGAQLLHQLEQLCLVAHEVALGVVRFLLPCEAVVLEIGDPRACTAQVDFARAVRRAEVPAIARLFEYGVVHAVDVVLDHAQELSLVARQALGRRAVLSHGLDGNHDRATLCASHIRAEVLDM